MGGGQWCEKWVNLKKNKTEKKLKEMHFPYFFGKLNRTFSYLGSNSKLNWLYKWKNPHTYQRTLKLIQGCTLKTKQNKLKIHSKATKSKLRRQTPGYMLRTFLQGTNLLYKPNKIQVRMPKFIFSFKNAISWFC